MIIILKASNLMDQLIHSKVLQSYFWSPFEITSDFYLCYSLCINSFMNLENNNLAGNPSKAFTKSSDFPTPTFCTLFCGSTLSPTSDTTQNSVVEKYTNKDLQRATKLMVDFFL